MNFMNQIKVSHRFLLAGSMSVVLAALPTYFFLSGEFSTRTVTSAEQAGVSPAREIFALTRLLQQHRGLSNRLLNGNAQVATELPPVQRALEQKQAVIAAFVESAGRPQSREKWKRFLSGWTALRGKIEGKSLSAPESFAAHSELIRQSNLLLDMVFDDSGLALDPVADTYHLVIATQEVSYLAEQQARLRGLGAGLLTNHSAALDDLVQLRTLVAQSQESHDRVKELFDKARATMLKCSRACKLSWALLIRRRKRRWT